MARVKSMWLWHGTSSKLWPEIQIRGLNSPCLTSDLEVAGYFAQEAAELDGGLPITLQVKVDASQLRVDLPAYEEPLTFYRNHWADSDEAWHDGLESCQIPFPTDAADWTTALRVTTCVKAEGIILPTRIKF